MKILINNKFYLTYVLTLLMPLFFLIDGNIYYFDNKIDLPSEKNIYNVPLPISIISSAILFLYIIYKKKINSFNHTILKILFFSTFLTFFCLLISGNFNFNKVLKLVQFLLPWVGLIIALNLQSNKNIFKVIYYFLFFFIGLQITITFFYKKLIIISDIFFFTVYQNIQYISSIFALLTIITSINLFKNNELKIFFLNFITLIYLILTYSFTAIFIHLFFIITSIIYLIYNFENKKNYIISYLAIFLSILIISLSYFSLKNYNLDKNLFIIKNKKNYYLNFEKFKDLRELKVPENVKLRIIIWKKYYEKIKNKKIILLFGDKNQNLDDKYSSAHNLIIDIIYSLGIFLVIPYLVILVKIIQTLIICNDKKVFFSIFFVTFIFVLENCFKLSAKQPYPGLITFFFIGYFLNKDEN